MLNNILTLSNEFIEEKREVSMVGTRLLYSFLRRIDKTDITRQVSLPIKEFCEEWELRESSNYCNIIKNIKQLAIAVHEKETEKENGRKVFETGVYFKYLAYDTASKTIKACLNDMFQTSFAAERGFAKIDFRVVTEINNRYGIRLYELLKQYEKFGKRAFEINELKNLLAIEEDKYKGRNDLFEAKVIKKGLSCINDTFPFSISCSKEGRAGKTKYTFYFDTMTVPEGFWDKEETIVEKPDVHKAIEKTAYDEFESLEVEEMLKLAEEYDDMAPPAEWTAEELAYMKREYEKGTLDPDNFDDDFEKPESDWEDNEPAELTEEMVEQEMAYWEDEIEKGNLTAEDFTDANQDYSMMDLT